MSTPDKKKNADQKDKKTGKMGQDSSKGSKVEIKKDSKKK